MSAELAWQGRLERPCPPVVQALQAHVAALGGRVEGVMASLVADKPHQAMVSPPSALGMARALEFAACELRDEHVGLRVARRIELPQLGALGFAAMAAPDAGSALGLFDELQGLLTTGVAMRRGRHAGGEHVWAEPAALSARYPWWVFLFGLRVHLLRQVFGRDIGPSHLTLPCLPPASLQVLQEVVGLEGRIAFGASYEERWPARVLQADNPRGSARIHQVMAAMARREWRERFDPDEAVIAALKGVILCALDRGAQPVLAALAPAVCAAAGQDGAVSVRQLQRRLAARGRTFRELVAQVRRERALAQLQATDRPLADIAAEAGYAELSSFHRAVRRWTGLTPMRLRRQALDEVHAGCP